MLGQVVDDVLGDLGVVVALFVEMISLPGKMVDLVEESSAAEESPEVVKESWVEIHSLVAFSEVFSEETDYDWDVGELVKAVYQMD